MRQKGVARWYDGHCFHAFLLRRIGAQVTVPQSRVHGVNAIKDSYLAERAHNKTIVRKGAYSTRIDATDHPLRNVAGSSRYVMCAGGSAYWEVCIGEALLISGYE